jgi:NAD(P)-dependent dehydrogenase (short-subunit alcohol dehydrogenase family)
MDNMDLGLKGKVAMVTGAGSQIGFGKGIALTLAKEGCDLVLNDINLEGVKKTAAEIEASGQKALALKADVTSSTEVKEMVKKAIQQFGKIDILVNNAGGHTPIKPFIEKVEADWDREINLNFKGVLVCTRAVLDHMISRKSGKIISISSIAGKIGAPGGGLYAATKAGVIAFSKSMAAELGPLGINVNCIAPGPGQTNFNVIDPPELIQEYMKMAPSRRYVTPQDIAYAVAFLASDVSSHIMGQVITVDGGFTMTG